MDIAFAPNGRMIATATVNQTTRLWEVGTWAARHAFPGVPTQLGKAAFSQDSRILAAKGADAPAYLWDVYGARTRTGPKPDAAALDRAWNDLASRDAAIGFRAIRTLITAPDDAVRLLRERLKPESALDATVLRRLLGELESPDFATRERATKEISDAVGNVEPAIRKALTESRSPEARRRLKVVLSHVGKPSPETLRAVRGVEALEVIGSETARALLKELARGPSGQRLTMEAQAAMARAKP
jgi:hypothetical protein